MNYREEVREFTKEGRWTFFKVLPFFLIFVTTLGGIGFGLKSLGIIGSTAVEREVFEQSYQRSASLKSQLATDQSVLLEIERKLSNPNLDKNTRFNLEAQASATRIRIETTKRKMQ